MNDRTCQSCTESYEAKNGHKCHVDPWTLCPACLGPLTRETIVRVIFSREAFADPGRVLRQVVAYYHGRCANAAFPLRAAQTMEG